MKDLRQTLEYVKYMQGLGWTCERINNINYFIRKILFLGAVIKIQRTENVDYEVIDLLSKKYRAFQIILEPQKKGEEIKIIKKGFRLSKDYFAPSKTLQIDLLKSEKQLLSEMHQKTRYNVKKIGNKNLSVRTSRDIEKFADFWQQCAIKQRGMLLSQKKEIKEIFKSFEKNAHLTFVEKDGELVSAILMICTKEIAYYVYAASSKKGKGLFGPTIATWNTIKLAKKLKRKVFDFEGIYDERFPIKSWQGFTKFKKSFGGSEVEYPGCYTKFRLPI